MISPQIYFQQYKAFETAAVYITESTDELQNEIYHNCLFFDMKEDHSFELDGDEFVAFLSKIKSNRKAQWRAANVAAGMICYMWFDEMAGQLRINFINSNHRQLPFGCPVEFVADEKEIISSFLNSTGKGTIPWSALRDTELNGLTGICDPVPFTLKVYQEIFDTEI
jgi:hypothetical protein